VVDATTKAIDRIVGFTITVRDFHLDSISAGQEALGRVKIIAVAPEGTFAGVGTSTDIVEASALAYMDVVNKVHRMRKFARDCVAGCRGRRSHSDQGRGRGDHSGQGHDHVYDHDHPSARG